MNSPDSILVDLKGDHFTFTVYGKESDLSLYGLHAEPNGKFRKYRGSISINNLIDLKENGFNLEYTDSAEIVRDALTKEYRSILSAQKWLTIPDEEIEEQYVTLGFHETLDLPPDNYQMRALLFAYHIKHCFGILEMGLGKSMFGATLLQTLLNHGKVRSGKMLICAPVQLHTTDNWPGEIVRFSNIRLMPVSCVEDFKREADAYLIGPELMRRFLVDKNGDYLKGNVVELLGPDVIIFDESSALKTGESLTTKMYHKLLARTRPKYQLLLTGLPAPNEIFQIWGQAYALGGWLGDSYTAFEHRYGTERSVNRGGKKKFFPKHGAYPQIMDRISKLCVIMKTEDYIELPPLMGPFIHYVDLCEEHMELYNEVRTKYLAKIDERRAGGADGEEVVADTESSLRIRSMQISNGFVGTVDDNDEKNVFRLNWNPKLDYLESYLENILKDPENHAIIWIRFREEFKMLFERFSKRWKCAYGVGGMTKKQREEQFSTWLRDPTCRIIIAHPASCKFGHTWNKANYAIWPSAPDDHEHYAQGRKRNHRRGQTRPVSEIRIYGRNTLDDLIWESMIHKQRLDRFIKSQR